MVVLLVVFQECRRSAHHETSGDSSRAMPENLKAISAGITSRTRFQSLGVSKVPLDVNDSASGREFTCDYSVLA